MLTYVDEPPIVRDGRPGYRPFVVRVARVARLTPHFTRVTFTGDELFTFGTDRQDQRVKLVLPLPGIGMPDFGANDPEVALAGDWYARLRALPGDIRPAFRTYTVRAVRPELAEVDIDMVWHGDGGPAAKWLSTVQLGDEIVLVGPDARSIHSAGGIDWHPGPAKQVLLAGDETAMPAICSIVEALPDSVLAHAFIEVPSADDVVRLPRRNECITWLSRDGREHGHRLVPAVRAFVGANRDYVLPALRSIPEELADIDVDTEMLWDSPDSAHADFYAWLAGESGVIKTLRRHLVTETGVDRRQVAFMGYWRLGKAEAQE